MSEADNDADNSGSEEVKAGHVPSLDELHERTIDKIESEDDGGSDEDEADDSSEDENDSAAGDADDGDSEDEDDSSDDDSSDDGDDEDANDSAAGADDSKSDDGDANKSAAQGAVMMAIESHVSHHFPPSMKDRRFFFLNR